MDIWENIEKKFDLNKSKEDMMDLTNALENWKHLKLEEEISKLFQNDEKNDSF